MNIPFRLTQLDCIAFFWAKPVDVWLSTGGTYIPFMYTPWSSRISMNP